MKEFQLFDPKSHAEKLWNSPNNIVMLKRKLQFMKMKMACNDAYMNINNARHETQKMSSLKFFLSVQGQGHDPATSYLGHLAK